MHEKGQRLLDGTVRPSDDSVAKGLGTASFKR